MRHGLLWPFVVLLALTGAAQAYMSRSAGSPDSRLLERRMDPFALMVDPFGDMRFDGWPAAEMKEMPAMPEIQARTRETAKDVVVELTIPGLQKDSLKVTVDDDRIRVAYDARTVQDKKDAAGHEYFRSESVESFEQVMPVPETADARGSRIARDGDRVRIVFPKRAPGAIHADA